jgi:hypothetical protein
MNVHVFAGPTIGAAEVQGEIDAVVSGPASFGDVCRAAQTRPIAIAIIDGYFERVPAVWHKEILWAMSEGVHVFGSSSMGALRAAELSDFGMEGVGAIYESYRNGELEDDDEVAIVHGPAEDGFAPLSEAMVNIRATLAAATAAGIVAATTAETLTLIAKAQFYGERSYPALILEAESQGVDAREVQALRAWLPRGRVDQKREDAKLLLRRIRAWWTGGPRRKQVRYRFEPTDAWHEAHRVALAGFVATSAVSTGPSEALIEELKIAGVYTAACQAAAARGAALERARLSGVRPDGVAVRGALEDFRRDRGFFQQAAFDQWRSEQRLEDAGLSEFFEDQARLQWALPLTESMASAHLVDHLRASGEYGRFAAKAEAKARQLEKLGLHMPSLNDVGVTEFALWAWYFEEHLARKVPDNLEAHARSVGFRSKEEMRSAVLRELYCARHRL